MAALRADRAIGFASAAVAMLRLPVPLDAPTLGRLPRALLECVGDGLLQGHGPAFGPLHRERFIPEHGANGSHILLHDSQPCEHLACAAHLAQGFLDSVSFTSVPRGASAGRE